MELEIEGLRGLKADLQKASRDAGDGMMKGLQAVGMEIIAEAKVNLNQNKTNNTGMLRSSGKVQKDKTGVDVGFFSKDSEQGYAAAVEYGRGPSRNRGEIPLRTTLKAWVHRKLGIPYGKELEKATYFITRKIHRKGTKPQPFFTPAVEKIADKIEDIVQKYIKAELP